ncbi:MAG: hypothetical protein QXY87_13610 [Saccharolobus sp.]|uniref:hypothetical protein n=1 Tax=Saccharolobus TaxID=2100760 RepID=UPI001F104AB7|nr:hypothetical protein [Saccharolobus shibatae]MCH4816709.1 hypothetical protein [Saccharolobus shibatae]
MTDEYLEYVLLDLSNRVGMDFSNNFNLELLPLSLQFKIRRACQLLKKLNSLKNMINTTSKKSLFNRSKKMKEVEEYKFEYERLEKEYLTIIDGIAKEVMNYL